MPAVVITGVSTGIGRAATQNLLSNGFRVFGSVRKASDAAALSAEFGAQFTPLLFDVTDEQAAADAAQTVREALQGETLSGLVNNAGVAMAGPLLELPREDFLQQLQVNLVGPFTVTQVFAPLLGTDRSLRGKPGRIVNISSVSGIRAMPFLGAYAASKYGLEGYFEALRRELLLYGIDVIVIGPGPVRTPIWDKADSLDTELYAQSAYADILDRFKSAFIEAGREGLTSEFLGELVHTALTTAHPRVRYAAVKGRLIEKLVMRLGSARMLDRLIGKKLGLLD